MRAPPPAPHFSFRTWRCTEMCSSSARPPCWIHARLFPVCNLMCNFVRFFLRNVFAHTSNENATESVISHCEWQKFSASLPHADKRRTWPSLHAIINYEVMLIWTHFVSVGSYKFGHARAAANSDIRPPEWKRPYLLCLRLLGKWKCILSPLQRPLRYFATSSWLYSTLTTYICFFWFKL